MANVCVCVCAFRFADVCCDHVEGGLYIGPEFQLGQVYDGTLGEEQANGENVVLYRPVYVNVRRPHNLASGSNDNSNANIANNNNNIVSSSNNNNTSTITKSAQSKIELINCEAGPSRLL